MVPRLTGAWKSPRGTNRPERNVANALGSAEVGTLGAGDVPIAVVNAAARHVKKGHVLASLSQDDHGDAETATETDGLRGKAGIAGVRTSSDAVAGAFILTFA